MFTIYRTLQCIVVKYGPFIFWNHKYPNYIYIYRVTWSSRNSRLWGVFPPRWCLWLKRFKTGFFSSSSNYWQTLGEIDQWLTGQMDKSYWKVLQQLQTPLPWTDILHGVSTHERDHHPVESVTKLNEIWLVGVDDFGPFLQYKVRVGQFFFYF